MKETFYFPHDNNAHNDPKIMSLFMNVWLSWIGLYWILIELLHQQESWMITKEQFENYIKWYSMKETWTWTRFVEQMLKCVETSWLFCFTDDWQVYSKRVLENKQFREDISKKRSDAWKASAKKRALIKDKSTSVEQNWTNDEQGKERKRKERKEKENKIIKLEESFSIFWNVYPKKVNKRIAEQRFMNLNLKDLENLFAWLDLYIKKWRIEETKKQFIPWPEVWIWNEKRRDEIICEWSPHWRSPVENEKAKLKKKQEDEKKSKVSEKINEEKRKILHLRNNLTNWWREEIEKQAKINAMKRYNKGEGYMKSPFAKPMLKAEIWILIKSKLW